MVHVEERKNENGKRSLERSRMMLTGSGRLLDSYGDCIRRENVGSSVTGATCTRVDRQSPPIKGQNRNEGDINSVKSLRG